MSIDRQNPLVLARGDKHPYRLRSSIVIIDTLTFTCVNIYIAFGLAFINTYIHFLLLSSIIDGCSMDAHLQVSIMGLSQDQ